MNKDNRKELIRAYKEKSPDAGVYVLSVQKVVNP